MTSLSELCVALGLPRYLVEQWINRKIFQPQNETSKGKSREYTLHDAIMLSILKDVSDAQLSLEKLASALNLNSNFLHGFKNDRAVLAISFADIELAFEGRPLSRNSGLQAKIVPERELLDHLTDTRRHVSIVIPLDKHEARVSTLFPK